MKHLNYYLIMIFNYLIHCFIIFIFYSNLNNSKLFILLNAYTPQPAERRRPCGAVRGPPREAWRWDGMRRATFFGCTVVLVLVLGLAPPSSPGAAEGPGDLLPGDCHPVDRPDRQATCRPMTSLSQDRRGEIGELSERARSATSRPGGPAIGGPPTPPCRNHWEGRGFGVSNGEGALRTIAPWGGCFGGPPITLAFAITGKDGDLG